MFKIRRNRARGEGTIYERQENLCKPKFVSSVSSFVVTASRGNDFSENFFWYRNKCVHISLCITDITDRQCSCRQDWVILSIINFLCPKLKESVSVLSGTAENVMMLWKKIYVVRTNSIFTGLSISFMQYFLYSFLQSSLSTGLTYKVPCWPTFVAPPCKHSIVYLEN